MARGREAGAAARDIEAWRRARHGVAQATLEAARDDCADESAPADEKTQGH